MKKLSFLLFSLICTSLLAQDPLQSELFTADVVMKYRSSIDLTKEQQKDVKKIHQNHISKFNSVKWDLDAEMVDLNKLLSQSSVDESATLEQMKVITDLENQMKMIRLQMLIKIKNELSQTQQSKLKELRVDKDFKPLKVITDINDGHKVKFQISGSKSQKDKPLYIMNSKFGEQVISAEEMSNLKPNEIESVSVLKGESAIEAYGNKGENGVVVITLKEK